MASLPDANPTAFGVRKPYFRWLGWVAFLAWLLTAGMLRARVAGTMDVWPRDNSVELGATQQFGDYLPISPNSMVGLLIAPVLASDGVSDTDLPSVFGNLSNFGTLQQADLGFMG